MTRKEKIMDWAFDHCEWLHFLLRDDVSLRFKVLNLLSGDRLRLCVAFTNVRMHDVKHYYDMIAELKAAFNDDLTLEEYDDWIQNHLGWHIDRAARECQDLWQI